MLRSLSEAPSRNKVRDIFPHSPECREMTKPTVADSHLNLVHLNNRYPAHARRAISVRTSAASLTPQHLLAASQPASVNTNRLETDFFFPIVCSFCWACPGKAGRLPINLPFRGALISRVLWLKGLLV